MSWRAYCDVCGIVGESSERGLAEEIAARHHVERGDSHVTVAEREPDEEPDGHLGGRATASERAQMQRYK